MSDRLSRLRRARHFSPCCGINHLLYTLCSAGESRFVELVTYALACDVCCGGRKRRRGTLQRRAFFLTLAVGRPAYLNISRSITMVSMLCFGGRRTRSVEIVFFVCLTDDRLPGFRSIQASHIRGQAVLLVACWMYTAPVSFVGRQASPLWEMGSFFRHRIL